MIKDVRKTKTPDDISPESIIAASWKGKDLLEATNQHAKSSLEFKDLMKKLGEWIEDENAISKFDKEIYNFAYLIYADEKRARIFTDQIIELIINYDPNK